MMTGSSANRRTLLFSMLALGSTAAVAHPATGADATSRVGLQVRVGGRVQREVLLTSETLGDFAKVPIADTPLRGRSGDTLRVLSGYDGIRLIDLLDKAQILAKDHNDLKKTIVVATATDNYKAVFSWNELYNTAVGEGVYLLVAKDGKPLGDEEGRFALISLQDNKTGPRALADRHTGLAGGLRPCAAPSPVHQATHRQPRRHAGARMRKSWGIPCPHGNAPT